MKYRTPHSLFKYGAEYGVECNVESGAKYYFIKKPGSRHGCQYNKNKKIFSMMILISIKQALSIISIIKT